MELKDIEIIINDKKSHTYNTQDLMEVFFIINYYFYRKKIKNGTYKLRNLNK